MGWWTKKPVNPQTQKTIKKINRIVGGILFLSAVVFHVPWKMLIVLFYFLIWANFPLPPHLKKWDRRFFFAALAGLLIWLFLPIPTEGYHPFRLEQIQLEIENDRAISPEQDAFPAYTRFIEQTDPNQCQFPSWPEALHVMPWKSEDHPAESNWLDERKDVLTILKSLSQYDHCRFPIPPTWAPDPSIDQQRQVIDVWIKTAICSSNRDIGDGKLEAALETFSVLTKMARHTRNNDLHHHLRGLYIERTVCRGCSNLVMKDLSQETRLIQIDTMIESMDQDWLSIWPNLFRIEKWQVGNDLCSWFYETGPNGQVRFAAMPLLRKAREDRIPGLYARFLTRSTMLFSWLSFPSDPYQFYRGIIKPFEYYSHLGEPGFDIEELRKDNSVHFQLNPTYMFSLIPNMCLEGQERQLDIFNLYHADKHGARIIIALQRYRNETGHWPNLLTELAGKIPPDILIDPTNGGEFVYQVDGGNFRLYSKGKNGIDDGGRRDKTKVTDDILFWPVEIQKTSSRKTK